MPSVALAKEGCRRWFGADALRKTEANCDERVDVCNHETSAFRKESEPAKRNSQHLNGTCLEPNRGLIQIPEKVGHLLPGPSGGS